MSESLGGVSALYLSNPELAIALRRRLEAEAQMRQGTGSEPIRSPWQGVNNLANALIGGWQAGKQDKTIQESIDRSNQELSDFQQALAQTLTGQQQGAAPTGNAPAAASSSLPATSSGPASSGGGTPFTGDPRDAAIRTVLAEAGGEGPEGMAAVAHVIRNRVNSGKWGDNAGSVVMAPLQFSPWNQGSTNDPRRFDPNSPEYKRAAQIWDAVNSGQAQDPTGGALNFANPRASTASWVGQAMAGDPANRTQIGNHVFFRGLDVGQPRQQYASAGNVATDAGAPAPVSALPTARVNPAALYANTGQTAAERAQQAAINNAGGYRQTDLMTGQAMPPVADPSNPNMVIYPDGRRGPASALDRTGLPGMYTGAASELRADPNVPGSQPGGPAVGGVAPRSVAMLPPAQMEPMPSAPPPTATPAPGGMPPGPAQAMPTPPVPPGSVAPPQSALMNIYMRGIMSNNPRVQRMAQGLEPFIKLEQPNLDTVTIDGMLYNRHPRTGQIIGPALGRAGTPTMDIVNVGGMLYNRDTRTGQIAGPALGRAPEFTPKPDDVFNQNRAANAPYPEVARTPERMEQDRILKGPHNVPQGSVALGPDYTPIFTNPADTSQRANQYRDEYIKLTGDFRTIQDAHNKITEAAKANTGAGDMGVIYGIMKMMDPGSTVREGEYATAANAGSVPERIRAAWNRTLTGERLDPTVRAEFVDQANSIIRQQRRQYEQVRSQYSEMARRNGIDPRDVIPEFTTPGISAAPRVPGSANATAEDEDMDSRMYRAQQPGGGSAVTPPRASNPVNPLNLPIPGLR